MTASQPDPPGLLDTTSGRRPSGLLSEPAPRLRADAQRNRARLLEAASVLVAERGVAELTMDAVAAAASVGKGTVFRRFGDRVGLLQALLARREERFQADFMAGPRPLGPDAPALERLHAFGPAVIRLEHTRDDLYLAARTDPSRSYTVPAHRLRLAHVTMLLRGCGAHGDTELLAHALIGYLDPALVHHLLTQGGISLQRLDEGWHDLVGGLTGRTDADTTPSNAHVRVGVRPTVEDDPARPSPTGS